MSNISKLEILLLEKGAVKFSRKGFVLNLHKDHPEVPLSPNYLDIRNILRNVKIRKLIAKLLFLHIVQIKPDLLVDLPQSISPLVATLSDITGIDIITIRSEALKGEVKKHGSSGPIMGLYEKGQTALIIDDVVSSRATTKEKAIRVLKEAGLSVLHVIIVVIDRQEGGKEVLEKMGFQLISLLKFKKMLKSYYDQGKISESLYRQSLAYAKVVKKMAVLK